MMVLADISGFTKLAEALATGQTPGGGGGHGHDEKKDAAPSAPTPGHGASKGALQRSGAEALVNIINSIFSRLIETTHEFGGDVMKFAGASPHDA